VRLPQNWHRQPPRFKTRRGITRGPVSYPDRVVFDILTNRYRLVTAVDFEKGIVWIKWIGTHKEYDKIDSKKVTYARH
jgi:mRNA interferase HigB